MTNRVSCIIVEDEPLAQNVLKNYIADHPALELTGVCANALEAQKAVLAGDVQLVFLDINLPGLSGISFLKSLVNPPKVIFTTAYTEYAVEGFELDAVDFLLKPFSFERFLKAVNKAIHAIQEKTAHAPAESPFIFLKADKKVHKVKLDSIIYLEAAGDYVKVVTSGGQHLVNDTMKKLEEQLPGSIFMRVHKSFIISKDKIRFFEGNYVKVGDVEIPIGASYRDEISGQLKGKNP